MKVRTVIPLLDEKVCDSDGDVVAAYTLAHGQHKQLAEAMVRGQVHLRVVCATKVGTPAFTLTGIEASIDGTNYVTLIELEPISCADEGEQQLQAICAPFDVRTKKLRFTRGGDAPDGSNKMTVTAELVVQIPK